MFSKTRFRLNRKYKILIFVLLIYRINNNNRRELKCRDSDSHWHSVGVAETVEKVVLSSLK